MKRTNIIKTCLVIVGVCLNIAITFAAQKKAMKLNDLKDKNENGTIKRILTWNNFFSMKNFASSTDKSDFVHCKVKNCELIHRFDDDPGLPHDQYDAVVFHGIDTGNASIQDLPLVRSPHQRYIFLLHESPAMRPEFYDMKNFFNWTVTYRRDSDIYMPYAAVVSKDNPRGVRYKSEAWRQPTFQNMSHIPVWVANKTKPVVWFVSDVGKSKRDVYGEELSKYINVDIYGRGRLTCPKTETRCDDMLDTTYKFYLAFENSLCQDYVTEKFARALQHNIVPIVFGGADYSAIAPPLSYINVKHFMSPKHLARYLHYLDANPNEYRKYFWWQRFYTANGYDSGKWCHICEKLNNLNEPNRVYPNMYSWWNNTNVCQVPEDYFSRSFYNSLYTVRDDGGKWWEEQSVCS